MSAQEKFAKEPSAGLTSRWFRGRCRWLELACSSLLALDVLCVIWKKIWWLGTLPFFLLCPSIYPDGAMHACTTWRCEGKVPTSDIVPTAACQLHILFPVSTASLSSAQTCSTKVLQTLPALVSQGFTLCYIWQCYMYQAVQSYLHNHRQACQIRMTAGHSWAA